MWGHKFKECNESTNWLDDAMEPLGSGNSKMGEESINFARILYVEGMGIKLAMQCT